MPETQNLETSNNFSIDKEIEKIFWDLNLNEDQNKRIKKCIEKKINWKNEKEINKLLNNFKKTIKFAKDIEKWIKEIENEINDLNNEEIKPNNEINTNEENDPNDDTPQNKKIISGIKKTMDTAAKVAKDWAIAINTVNNETAIAMTLAFGNIVSYWWLNLQETFYLKVSELFVKTKDAHEKLASKYKEVTSQEVEQKKSSLPEDTKKKLEENNVDVEEYIQYTISRDKIYEQWTDDNTPETKDFLSNLKNLEDELWIRTETARWLPLTVNTATFEANPDLKKFKDTDPEISKLWNTSYFWKENIDTSNLESLKSTLVPYKKMELIYKNDVNFPKDEKFQEISKKIFDEDYSNLTQDDINYYTTKLDGLNWWITDYIKWSAAQAPLTWILRYLDSYTWFNKDTLQDRFWKGKDEFITMQDSTMRIEWVIDGKPLSFYYDTKDWQTKICCDDVLHIENNKYQIYDWEWKHPRSDLKIKMPSTKDIVSNLQNMDQDIFKKILEGSSDANDFKRNITDYINNKIKESFPENDEIKTRMWRFTEKNLAAQAFDSALIGRTEYKRKINEQTETWLTPIRKVLLLVDNTTEKSTSSELVEFKWALKKLEWLLWKPVEEINKITDPVLRENLLNLKHGKEQENYENWETSIINFFKLFERRDPNDPEFKINIDDFSSFIDQWSKKENIKLDNFSKEFSENYEKMNPEKRLAQEQWKKIQELAEEKHERESEEADIELMASLEAIESMEIPTESNLW